MPATEPLPVSAGAPRRTAAYCDRMAFDLIIKDGTVVDGTIVNGEVFMASAAGSGSMVAEGGGRGATGLEHTGALAGRLLRS